VKASAAKSGANDGFLTRLSPIQHLHSPSHDETRGTTWLPTLLVG
jgi:hypothetical protein